MNIINETRFAAGYAPGRLKSGRDCLVLVAKATYSMPVLENQKVELLSEQLEPLIADVSLGDPASTPILYENDYAPIKASCDVTLVGSAYAPAGQEVNQIAVKMSVANINKTFNVVGNRYWQAKNSRLIATEPEPFNIMPIHYGLAYGGMGNLNSDDDDEDVYVYQKNMYGRGYYGRKVSQDWVGQPLPNTEEYGRPITKPLGDYIPMSFGPIARNAPERIQYAGTYDKQWEQQKAPFLPEDFDERFYQSALQSQQIPFIQGGELVELYNLVAEGPVKFNLPSERLNMHIVYRNGTRHDMQPVIDSLVLEPDQKRFSMTWRLMVPLKRNMKEVETMIVGQPSRAWEIARLKGKTYVPMSQLKEYRHILRR